MHKISLSNFTAYKTKTKKHLKMSLDKSLPSVPNGKLAGWLAFFSVVLILGFVIDTYWGNGNLFGLAKKKTEPTV